MPADLIMQSPAADFKISPHAQPCSSEGNIRVSSLLSENALLQVRKAQVNIGDREVYVNEEGERMSRLKEVNSDWIIRRLERWGQRVWPQRCSLQQGIMTMSCLVPSADFLILLLHSC